MSSARPHPPYAGLDRLCAAETARIGTEIGVSDWLTVDQPMIDGFAALTMDDQFIHVDPDRARAETRLGGTIAHGFLTLSLASKFALEVAAPLSGQVMGFNYGFDRLRFLAPVRSGARLRGRFTLRAVRRRAPAELLRTHGLTIEIEAADTPALVADWLTLAVFAAER